MMDDKCYPGGPKHDWVPDGVTDWVCDRCGETVDE